MAARPTRRRRRPAWPPPERYGDHLGAAGTSSWTRDGSGDRPRRVAARLGDVALVPHAPIAFLDPADTGETGLAARHGSLTAAEMLVPLLALGGDGSIWG